MWALEADIEKYKQLSSQLEQQGIDPGKYGQLLTQQTTKQEELQQIEKHKSRRECLAAEAKETFGKIEENRKSLSENRQKFLCSVLEGNESVSIKVKPFGQDWGSIEKEIRDILQCQGRFNRDIESLKNIYQQSTDDKTGKLKEAITRIRNGETDAMDNRFANHLRKLPQESISNLIVWFPGDNLKVTFGPQSSTNRTRISRSKNRCTVGIYFILRR